jgi:UDP-glucuronate 4-epimerase
MHPGDLPDTKADTESLQRALDFKPSISAEVGIKRFVDWYLAYYGH